MQRKVLVGTTDGLHELQGESSVKIAGHEVKSLATGDSGWWAIIDDGEVWRSANGGPWKQVASVDYLNPNPPMDRDGRREDSGRG